jgi:two-component system chemotaxis response regulator CheY
MRALVVDDSAAMRAILRIVLKRQGFEVLEAKQGHDALSVLLESEHIDLILIDWNMPEMNGFELLQRVRRDPDYDCTRIMMVTTETSLDQMSIALLEGANENSWTSGEIRRQKRRISRSHS